MCFYLKSKKAKIAKKDIECFKFLEPDNSPPFAEIGHSCYDSYENGVINPRVRLTVSEGKYINKGYHSYIWKQDCDMVVKIYSWGVVTHKFIIPAGTRYYQNDTEYVSETIILID